MVKALRCWDTKPGNRKQQCGGGKNDGKDENESRTTRTVSTREGRDLIKAELAEN